MSYMSPPFIQVQFQGILTTSETLNSYFHVEKGIFAPFRAQKRGI